VCLRAVSPPLRFSTIASRVTGRTGCFGARTPVKPVEKGDSAALRQGKRGGTRQMDSSPGLQLLADTRALLGLGWCQRADARRADGQEVQPWDEHAASWSILGAIVAVLEREAVERGEIPLEELAAALYALADVITTDSLEAWNDDPKRTQDEVVRVITAAEARFEPPWPQEAQFFAN
jgi:hypothetical protein